MIVYHGSDHIIEKPVYNGSKRNNDYGYGFYTTESLELAKEWACGDARDGFANMYEFDTKGLNILDLNAPGYSILNWLAILAKHRTYWQNNAISEEAKEYLQKYFYVDLEAYDVIKGYRADDSYFSFAQDFVAGTISLSKLSSAMRLGNLGEQIVLKSPKAFENIVFVDAKKAEAATYYEKKLSRDKEARRAYRQTKTTADNVNELFMIDILREEIKNGDPRLR